MVVDPTLEDVTHWIPKEIQNNKKRAKHKISLLLLSVIAKMKENAESDRSLVFCMRTIAITLALKCPYLSPFLLLVKTHLNSISSKFGFIANLYDQRSFIFMLEA